MKLDIFSIPIYIDNIDCSKIKLETDKYEKIWDSNITSSHGHENKLNQESFNYILEKIWKLLNDDFHGKFKLNLENIWQNKYLEKDYQETHCHPQSHFSFIIYKQIKESRTVFNSPFSSLIVGFYPMSLLDKMNILRSKFKPSCTQNQIIVFPSFLEHYVLSTTDAVTIAGNITLEEV